MTSRNPSLDFPHLRGFAWAALIAYFVLIFYGSLYPFSEWRMPQAPLFDYLTPVMPKYISMSDVWVNAMVYIPLGLLLAGLMRRDSGLPSAVFTATLIGGGISFLMETLQMFLPGRVSSVLDLALNTSGSLFGALLVWVFYPHSWFGRQIAKWRNYWFLPGLMVEASLFLLLFAMLAGLSPLLPSLRGPGATISVMPLWQALIDTSDIPWVEVGAYAAKLLGLGLFTTLLVAPGRPNLRPFYFFLVGVLLIKLVGAVLISSIPLVQWRFSVRAILGITLGALLLWDLASASRRLRAIIAAVALVAAFMIEELAPGSEGLSPSPFNWVPFLGQMYGFTGILDILASPTPFLVLGLLANLTTPLYRRAPVAIGGGLAVLALTFALELAQQHIPGRTADITDVLLYASGWFVAWLWWPHTQLPHQKQTPTASQHAKSKKRRWLNPALVFAALLAVGVPAATLVIEQPLSDKYLPKLPTPDELPPVNLPNFRTQHPRLPAPTSAEIARLQAENPGYFEQQEGLAKRGDLYPIILLARIFPGSQDLTKLHQRLMGLDIHFRGNNAELIALAYDWLYDQWTERQRKGLRDRVAEGTEFLIKLIRVDRLSPYNVYLYNSPFQRLMVASIVLYKDDPRGEFAMRFTNDMWKHRILPVWRQIMGKNGGWHEGGEYIALGIGQAVYQLPALWRHATGEDYFKTEPGIRGFMDFILYRLRPDGNHYRIGDANFGERIAQDLTPLALEYRDAAAYSVRPPPTHPSPSSWPWGPLTDLTLLDTEAVKRRPLTKLLDGIGIVVARSSWEPDATYVTFKAGDNFWSHSHLDQGSFTIFKGGPLAIDSGLYGAGYGSDHHMNYTYQTIAHNTVTVTDPADTTPARNKKGERSFANDGGQRRIGSGWGIEPAPMDLAEWNAKREIYHTGKIEQFTERDGVTIVVADLTPAYTNRYSGEGTFSHRTRRVEQFRRTFVYDRINDVIVIFDRVVATKASFRKRWLLHTLEQPQIVPGGFIVRTAPDAGLRRAGGILKGLVLLPEQAQITAVGGNGAEFLVDSWNYDEAGKLRQTIRGKNDPDIGEWRIEVSPSSGAREDTFLTVLVPSLDMAATLPTARLLKKDNQIGCELSGPHRPPMQLWFSGNNVDVKFSASHP